MELLTWKQLVQHAGGRATAEGWIREGRWWRVVRGAYAPVERMDDLATRLAALRLVLPPGTIPSHRTALWLIGALPDVDVLEVTVPRGRHLRRRPGLRVWSARVTDDELCLVSGLCVAAAPRAFLDVARHDSLIEAVAVGDAVLRSGAATHEQLLAAVEAAGGVRGIRAARAALPHLESRSESLMESRFRMRLVLGGVPRPEAQFDVYDDDGHVGRGDLHLDGVVLEYDGLKERRERPVFVAERRRQTRMAETGLEIRRFTANDYYVRPAAAVCAEVLRAVTQAVGRDRSALRTGPDTLRRPRLRPLPTVAEQRTRRDDAA
jgi:hypothetical protein